MPTDDAIRASDADREHAVGLLRDGYACGRLTLAEFDERTTAAFASKTARDAVCDADLRSLAGGILTGS